MISLSSLTKSSRYWIGSMNRMQTRLQMEWREGRNRKSGSQDRLLQVVPMNRKPSLFSFSGFVEHFCWWCAWAARSWPEVLSSPFYPMNKHDTFARVEFVGHSQFGQLKFKELRKDIRLIARVNDT